MDLNSELCECFGDYMTEQRTEEWESVKAELQIGQLVSGTVVARRPFGVFVDIGAGFPALVLVVNLKDARTTPYSSIDMYPQIGDHINARVNAFVDHNRQIGMTEND
ncbi:MAG: S1 RNA-binding domain-containing protein [Planctomycetaceae bacterium]